MTVELSQISRQFGASAAVSGIDLTVAEGEFLALIGPSGAGKTTLLRIIAGLERGYTGRLSIHDRDVTDLPARDRNIGFVFQNYALFRNMTVAENVAFGLRVQTRAVRPARREIDARVRDLLALVQVPDLAGRYPAQLSGGQRQRVALARALATEPGLLLLDEPFGALDPLVRKDIRTWLRGLHDRLGLTSVFVTHDQAEAMELADRIAVLRNGRLEQVGTPEALEARPASAFVYQFLGETIRLEGGVADGWLTLDDLRGVALPTALPNGRGCALIRPYDIHLVPGEGGVVTDARRAGGFIRYAVALPRRTIEVLAPVNRPVLPPGTACALDFGAARQFAAETAAVAPTPVAASAAFAPLLAERAEMLPV
ncbi:MAG TPA: ATP-binding cassette domain-containing protein [Acetobacteraceae bacterium]|nr:ATP-binding cassette domain-containing protein [Acetobacteraceae bacterium]